MATNYLFEGLVTVSGTDALLPAAGDVMPGTTISRPLELSSFLAIPVGGSINWRFAMGSNPTSSYPVLADGVPLTISGSAIPKQGINGYSAGSVTVYVAWG